MKSYALLAALLTLATAQARAEDDTQPVWSFETNARLAVLDYSTPQSDDIRLSFFCKPHSGVAEVMLSETDSKLKAGKKASATISVGATKTIAAGKLEPNEDAGAPSFTGRLKADDPLFAAMAEGKEIVLTVGPSKTSEPLKGVAEKVKQFTAACVKK